MAFKVNSVTLFDDSGNLPWGQISAWAGTIKQLSVSSSGDGTNPIGTSGVKCTSASFNTTSNILSLGFDTNCVCVCVCVCDCSGGGGGG